MYGMYCSGTTGQAVLQSGSGLWGQTRKWSSGCWWMLSVWLLSSSPSVFWFCKEGLEQHGGLKIWLVTRPLGLVVTGYDSELLRAFPWSHKADHLLWRAWRSGMMSWSRLDDKWNGGGGCFSSSIGFVEVCSVSETLRPCEPDHTLSWVFRHDPDGVYFSNEAGFREYYCILLLQNELSAVELHYL